MDIELIKRRFMVAGGSAVLVEALAALCDEVEVLGRRVRLYTETEYDNGEQINDLAYRIGKLEIDMKRMRYLPGACPGPSAATDTAPQT